ncbi:class I SAM-dependent methyltransferase [Desulfocurvus sp. DL9XJH121]
MANFYSNAKMDTDKSARHEDEKSVRSMYEFAPYPDLGANLKDLSFVFARIDADLSRRGAVRFLDVGCGTGHIAVGVAKSHPAWECFGLDLSDASLGVARQLAAKHGAKVDFARGSYLDPLPFDGLFDIISAQGTIHHCADPVGALQNLRKHLKDDGFLSMHLYGMRCDQEKFDIKEVLSILEPDLTAYDRRFKYYRALVEKKKSNWFDRLARTSPRDVYAAIRDAWRNYNRKRKGISWSPSFRENYPELNAQWIDHFCHPCERAYEVPDVQKLVEASGFSIVHMIGQGSERLGLIPDAWRERYQELGEWDKYRLSELLSPGPRSFSMILKPE